MNNPFFSIIVPVYNASKYLEECIVSVLRQEISDYELILVDDGSTDESASICDIFSAKYETIRTFHKENEGPIPTRLFGLQQAKGKYIIHLDADDYLEKKALNSLKSAFQKNQCDCIIYGFRSFKDNKVLTEYTVNKDHLSTDKHEIYTRFFSTVAYNALVRKAYKRDVVNHGNLNGFFHIHKGEDLLLSLGVIRCCKSIFFSKEILYNYRMNDESITHKKEPLPKTIEFTLPKIALDFIRKEAEFNEKELDNYRKTRYREAFIPLIKRIALADSETKEKTQLFKIIRETNYYNEFLGKRIIHSYNNIIELIILGLFRNGFDQVLITTLRTVKNIKKIAGSKHDK